MKNSSASKSNSLKYILGLILATVVWGFSFITQLSGSETIGEFWFNGLRFLLGGTVLLIPAILIERKQYNKEIVKKTIIYGFFTGLFLFGAVTFQQLGVMWTKSPGISAFLTDSYTLLVPIAMFLLFKKHIKLQVWAGVILATIGLYLLCVLGVKADFYSQTTTMLLGEGMLVICALFFTAHVIFIDRVGGSLPSLLYCVAQFITIGVLGCLVGIFKEPISFEIIKNSSFSILYCGLFSVGIGYTLQVVCQKKIDPILCVIIFPLESVFSTTFSALLGKDKLSFTIIMGCILIFVGLIVADFDFKRLFKKK